MASSTITSARVLPPSLSPSQVATIGAVTGTSRGTTLTGGSANTKGAWVELSAATPIAASGFTLNLNRPAVVEGCYMVDVGIGAGGAEQVILSNIAIDLGSPNPGDAVFVPLAIAAGTRVAARMQADGGSATLQAQIFLHAGSFVSYIGLTRATTYGADTATSSGTQLPFGTANTKGAYAQLTAATTNPIRQLLLLMGLRSAAITTSASALIDVAVGAAASEVVIVENVSVFGSSNGDKYQPISVLIPISVNSGQRLTARAQYDQNAPLDVIVIGFD